MTAAFADPAIHRMTVEQYEKFVSDHDLDRVELIDGVIYDVSPEMNLHARAVMAILKLLVARFPDRLVMNCGSVRIDSGSLWEPDLYVVNVVPDHAFDTYPDASDLLLAVEVSGSTWSRDAGLKRDVYARNGIPEYWVIDPNSVGGVVARHTEPSEQAGGFVYSEVISVSLSGGIRGLGATWTAIETL
jgi:Uma2 family endonuclease